MGGSLEESRSISISPSAEMIASSSRRASMRLGRGANVLGRELAVAVATGREGRSVEVDLSRVSFPDF